ncbi:MULTISPECIES: cupin domain-containing protein [unclassified Endozoicomonas]|uniref:cupin domain-containing protein n=1 Tax=unclassified Endozoicomonas TaxID=2644528 RepID=UPI0021480837|nr:MULTISPECIES: cupin domain-containing protein [unclassified Endozoicomonas]
MSKCHAWKVNAPELYERSGLAHYKALHQKGVFVVKDANGWIEALSLQPHPEGGFFRETYRSDEVVARDSLPDRFSGERNFSTAIYYLLEGNDFSAFHRIQQDEIWHFYDGASLTIHVIAPDGNYCAAILGRDIYNGEVPQFVVTAGCLFAVEVNDSSSFVLSGCTVAPGFDFADFEMPSATQLLSHFPQHAALIERLTR